MIKNENLFKTIQSIYIRNVGAYLINNIENGYIKNFSINEVVGVKYGMGLINDIVFFVSYDNVVDLQHGAMKKRFHCKNAYEVKTILNNPQKYLYN